MTIEQLQIELDFTQRERDLCMNFVTKLETSESLLPSDVIADLEVVWEQLIKIQSERLNSNLPF